jgi:hypothetical protein
MPIAGDDDEDDVIWTSGSGVQKPNFYFLTVEPDWDLRLI